MTTYTLSQASKAAGRSKSTILRSIKMGRVSATRDELTGGWNIDAAELHRVYDASNGRPFRDTSNDVPGNTPGNDVLQAKLDAAETRLVEKDAVIDDLRQRLDLESEERRRLTAILTDQRGVIPVSEFTVPRSKSRWFRWFRRRSTNLNT